MRGNALEAIIGAIVLVIASFFVYFAYETSGQKIKEGYEVLARFGDISGITSGSDVKLNGIKIGTVQKVSIDKDYQASITLLIKDNIKIPEDSSLTVTTDGIMGNKYIAVNAGFSSEMIKPGAEIEKTKSAMNLESLIENFAIGTK